MATAARTDRQGGSSLIHVGHVAIFDDKRIVNPVRLNAESTAILIRRLREELS